MISFENVYKAYDDTTILRNINIQIKQGEFVSIIGPSGCGKSTLISLVAGLTQPSQGTITVNGSHVTKTDINRMMIFQSAALFPWLTVYENVAFGLKNICKDKVRVKRLTLETLRSVYLLKYGDYYPHQLSGGMKQRVSIARSLVMQPDILLMDEPFSALDEQTRTLLHCELQKIWIETKKTIMFVTHNLREAVKLSTRVIVLGIHPGSIVDDIDIPLPYPRHTEDSQVFEIEKRMYSTLKIEIEKVVKEELGVEYEFEENPFSDNDCGNMGGGI